MRNKLILLALVGFILVLLGANLIKVSSKSKQEELKQLDRAEDKNTIAWYVRVAKAKGEKTVALPVEQSEYANGFETLDQALQYNEAIIGMPIEKRVVYTDDSLRTWYKIKILEDLSDKNRLKCSDCTFNGLTVPQELLPLNTDEILMVLGGGSATIDGVQVTYDDPLYPQFQLSKKYFLFFQTDQSRQIGLIRMGPTGVYTIGDDKLSPVNENPHPIKSEIINRYNSSIESLRSHVHSKVD
jgi:hypothetical protein